MAERHIGPEEGSLVEGVEEGILVGVGSPEEDIGLAVAVRRKAVAAAAGGRVVHEAAGMGKVLHIAAGHMVAVVVAVHKAVAAVARMGVAVVHILAAAAPVLVVAVHKEAVGRAAADTEVAVFPGIEVGVAAGILEGKASAARTYMA